MNKFTKIANRLKRVKKGMTTILSNETVRFYKQNWRRQGFLYDTTIEKWQPRKKRERGRRRAILVKTGNLRDSIWVTDRTSTSWSVGTDVVYAKRHNKGLGQTPQRKFIGRSLALNRRLGKLMINSINKALKDG